MASIFINQEELAMPRAKKVKEAKKQPRIKESFVSDNMIKQLEMTLRSLKAAVRLERKEAKKKK